MEYAHTTASDGCKLAFQTSLPLGAGGVDSDSDPRYRTLIILIHGFSGSSAYFERNFAALSSAAWVVAVDLRGHGESGRPRGGYHVARLAADLRELVAHLRSLRRRGGGPSGDLLPLRVVPVGCSIGAAVLWTYAELFGDGDFAGMVFADQAPLQDRSPALGDGGGSGAVDTTWDESRAHRGCYDEASMRAAQAAWTRDTAAAHRGLVSECLGYRFAPLPGDGITAEQAAADEAFFAGISSKCDPVWLARLLADHTRYDHREAIEDIRAPVLVLAGRRTGCFPLEGMRETVERVKKGRRDRGEDDGDNGGAGPAAARWEVFESGHWMFWEESDKFNKMITEFATSCS
ncbi:Alpha/Beta hydrolase protein [Xylariales sp. PMI_506]|nr:Alpha/Beta hydrolase protein [Xylariales sp. PMI_506]